MSTYLVQLAFTAETWSTLVKNPQDRVEAIRPVVERLGGTVTGAWYAFGDYDTVAVFEFPNNTAAAAISLAFTSGGAIKSIKTTPLLSTAEAMDAMRLAAGTGYRPPA